MDEGEHWLRKGKLDRALASANLAVVRAPIKDVVNKEDLDVAPLSLWIRSEILYEMGEYQLSLNDIQLALKYHLPNDLKGDVYLRMGKCYLNLGDKKKCTLSLNIARSCGNSVVQEQCNKILNDVDRLIKPQPEQKGELFVTESLTDMPGISKSLTLCHSTNCGRYLQAAFPISVGEIVSSEEPYVSALFIDKHGTHCLHCYTRLKAPIPCPECSGVGFCSIECLNEGMKYHKWECHYLELHIGSGMSVLSHLTLRIITQKSLEYFKNAKSTDHEYNKVLKLEGHFKQRDGQDLLRRTLMALFLLQSLRHSGYFRSESDVSPCLEQEDNTIGTFKEEEIYIGCLLLHNLQVLQFNGHEIYETVISQDNKNHPGIVLYIALGLYLNTAMLNHQCQPTLARYFQGKKIILRAQHPISVGDEVTENYGPVFTMRTKEQRQNILRGRYLFDCNCEACLLDWPMLSQMVPEPVFFRCKEYLCTGSVPSSGICQACGKIQSIKEEQVLYHSYENDWCNAASLMKSGGYAEAETIITQYVKNMWKLVHQPNKNLCLALEALRTIWASTTGNVSFLPIKVKNNVS